MREHDLENGSGLLCVHVARRRWTKPGRPEKRGQKTLSIPLDKGYSRPNMEGFLKTTSMRRTIKTVFGGAGL